MVTYLFQLRSCEHGLIMHHVAAVIETALLVDAITHTLLLRIRRTVYLFQPHLWTVASGGGTAKGGGGTCCTRTNRLVDGGQGRMRRNVSGRRRGDGKFDLLSGGRWWSAVH